MDPNQLIDQLGGTSKVAQLCEVTKASVSQWRTNGIPRARLMFLRLARPELFAAVEGSGTPVRGADCKPSAAEHEETA